MNNRTRIRSAGPALLLALALATGACGTGEDTAAGGQGQAVGAAADDSTTTEDTSTDDSGSDEETDDSGSDGGGDDSGSGDETEYYDTGDITSNDCPEEGCLAQIIDIVWAGDQLDLTLDANYKAIVDGGNHFHIYWDNWKPEEVSAGNAVGRWVATAAYPVYNTGDDPATTVGGEFQGDATKICVTPADKTHNVIDPANFDCWDLPER